MKAFITGIAGFAGSHLCEYLLTNTQLNVSGLIHSRVENISHLQDQIELYQGDLFDLNSIGDILSAAHPDYIFHLAGEANVPFSFSSPWQTFQSNVLSQINLLEKVRELVPGARILIVGSAEEYGQVRPEDIPINESVPFRPDTPYGVSKVAQDMVGLQYHLQHNISIVRARAFNHIGARQTERFVASAFAKQIARIEAGLEPAVLRVGNLTSHRDFTDVRDTVRAYALLIERGQPGEAYNVGSGISHGIDELLAILLSFVDIAIEVQIDHARLRPSDVPVSCCDYSKLHAVTGWQPSISFREGLLYTLNYWREKVKEG